MYVQTLLPPPRQIWQNKLCRHSFRQTYKFQAAAEIIQKTTRTQQQAETVIWMVLRPGWQTSLR